MFEADHRAKIVHTGLARRSAASGRDIGLGVVQYHPAAAGRVGKAAGWHAQEHGFADSPRYLIAVHWRGVFGVDDWLHAYLARGVGEEAAYVSEGDRSYSLEPADAASECRHGRWRPAVPRS